MSLTSALKDKISAADYHEETAAALTLVLSEAFADSADAIIEVGLDPLGGPLGDAKFATYSLDGQRVVREDVADDIFDEDERDELEGGLEFTESEIAEAMKDAEESGDDLFIDNDDVLDEAGNIRKKTAADSVTEATDVRMLQLGQGEVLVI